MLIEILPWALFGALVIGLLALDLGVFHRDAHEVKRREALTWSAAWIGLALVFNAGVYVFRGSEAGIEWTTGYILEKTLSVDNIFVILLIFSAFSVPPAFQHRVLFWGIVGAVVMRAVLIGLAGFLIDNLHFVIYIFGAFLVFTGVRFLRDQEHTPDVAHHPVVRFANRVFRTTPSYEGQKFFTRRDGLLYATPLFIVLLLIESTDLVFAVDSIPAIYAITDDPFIVFTSNIFAILGLRSLYFVLAGYLTGLAYLKPALAAVLVFVGVKMLAIDVFKIPAPVSLGVIATILSVAILASVWKARRTAAEQAAVAAAPLEAG